MPELRIIDFSERFAGVDFAPTKIIVARRAYLTDAPITRFRRPVCVGDQRARQANKIAGAVGNCRLSLNRHGNAADGHYWRAGGSGTQLFVDVQKMPVPKIHIRHMGFQAQGEVTLTVSEIVEHAIAREDES